MQHELKEQLPVLFQKYIIQFTKESNIPKRLVDLYKDVDNLALQYILQTPIGAIPKVTEQHIRDTRKALGHFVISPLDKNLGLLHVQCKRSWHSDLEKTFHKDEHYSKIDQVTVAEVLETQRVEFYDLGLHQIAPWQKGEVPEGFILKKSKDIKKIRPVISCYAHPARIALSVLAKGGTLVISLAHDLCHFDIQSVHHMAEEFWDENSKPDDWRVTSFDVKQMFTELTHEGMLEDVQDFLKELDKHIDTRTTFYVKKGNVRHKAELGEQPQ